MNDLRNRLDLAIAAAIEGGEVALGHYRNLGALTIEHKGVQDPVSEADRQTEDLIKTRILGAFPGDAFVGEESGAQNVDESRGTWVVDPIDGTQPFLLGIPAWCVSIAYVEDGQVQIGVIRDPVLDVTYAAMRGHGATRNGQPMKVSDATALNQGLTGLGCSSRTNAEDLGHMARELRAAGGMYHRIGSGALTLTFVATGQLIGYIEMYINSWDCLAAVLLIQESDGVVNDFLGQYGITGGGPIVAGAPGVYSELMSLLPAHVREIMPS